MDFNIVEKLLNLTLMGTEWVLWLLIFLSVVSVAIIFERFWYFARMRINFPSFSRDLASKFGDKDALKTYCEAHNGLESQVILQGIENIERGPKAMEESMTGFLIGQRQYLDRGLVVLGTLGNNAPFIGLFGTVLGIIQAFYALSESPDGSAAVMSAIAEALVATAVGLLVAIPAVIFFNFFQRVVKRKLANAEAVKNMILAHYS